MEMHDSEAVFFAESLGFGLLRLRCSKADEAGVVGTIACKDRLVDRVRNP